MIEYWMYHTNIYKLVGKKGYFRDNEGSWRRWENGNEQMFIMYVRRVGRQVANDFELAYYGTENDN